ncbi:MAG: RNA degradosome polyphosphate kinase [Acidimicrobiia bacterium]
MPRGRAVIAVQPAATTERDRCAPEPVERSGSTMPEMADVSSPDASRAPESPERFLNRELSWLDFNARVLALGEDETRPLLERAKFLAIFSANLDEFFQVRVSGLKEQLDAGLRTRSPDGRDPLQQLREIATLTNELVTRQAAIFTKDVAPALEEVGIRFADWEELDDADRAHLEAVFEEQCFPILTPLAVDPAHPFPYISNLSLNLAVVVRDPASNLQRFARVKVPPLLPRFVALPDAERFVPIEQVIATGLDRLFEGMEIVEHHPFRVTRDADFELTADESDDLLAAIEVSLSQRRKSPRTVRLEINASMSEAVLDLLCRELEIHRADVYVIDGPLDLTGLWGVYELDRPELKDDPWTPQTQPVLVAASEPPRDFFSVLRDGDVLVHHPYDSFTTSVETFIAQAAADPHVLAIKQTLYRTAGPESAIVQSLAHAAEAGKQVVALVELQARFDEEANIDRARVLEEAGVHVVYGVVGLKTHAKILLVVRDEQGGIRRYCHIGTGNYNPKTATLYEDVGLFSSSPDLGSDLSDLFNHLTGYSRHVNYRTLLVAPDSMRSGLIERVQREAAKGGGGRITLKMNALVDPALIESLYAASAAGCRIELIVRGICCLRPQVPGLSEHIVARSILGEFLEHSRIYRFGADPASAEYLIGSADLMPRNLDRRVEAVVPVTAAPLRARLDEILLIELADDTLAWELNGAGTWEKVTRESGTDTHRRLQELAVTRAQGGTPVDARR